MRFLRGESPMGAASSPFRDAWLALHPEPKPRSTDPWEIDHALTFPSCNPVKRIDYILVNTHGPGRAGNGARDASEGPAAPMRGVVESCRVVGQSPGEAFTPRPGLGMADEDSPGWASDHRAVVAQLRL